MKNDMSLSNHFVQDNNDSKKSLVSAEFLIDFLFDVNNPKNDSEAYYSENLVSFVTNKDWVTMDEFRTILGYHLNGIPKTPLDDKPQKSIKEMLFG